MKTALLGLEYPQVWDTVSAFQHLHQLGQADTKRTAERRLHELGIVLPALDVGDLRDELGRVPTPSVLQSELVRVRAARNLALFVQLHHLPNAYPCLHANDARGGRYWIPFATQEVTQQAVISALALLQAHLNKPLALFPHGELTRWCRNLHDTPSITYGMLAYPAVLDWTQQPASGLPRQMSATHLARLEAESIHIIREAVAEAENPVMLYSVGKDSAVMLHLVRKAFYPAKPPMPLLHVDTRWKFQEMYAFRDYMASISEMDLIVHINPDAIAKDINPFDHGSSLHTDITKTEGLKQALDKYKFDVAFGGARRDEEKSRAKERIFSFRTSTHQWDAKRQRPEVWNLYNTHKNQSESIRVFPLSNWTELDIWQYIYQENIPVVPLYFAKERPVVMRDGMMIMVDDARMRLLPDEVIHKHKIRFRTLGCYPLTGAVASQASNIAEIILELLGTNSSERQGRAIDADAAASMEKKKQAGYF
jgi:sulfate adenylyltransferase subunit 2